MKILHYYKQNTLLSWFQYEHLNIRYIIPQKMRSPTLVKMSFLSNSQIYIQKRQRLLGSSQAGWTIRTEGGF